MCLRWKCTVDDYERLVWRDKIRKNFLKNKNLKKYKMRNK